MLRSAIGALSLAFATATASAQIIPQPICTPIQNSDFSLGSAFYSVDIETGEFGDTGTGVFTSFTPLGLAPNNGNVATFFTEALAEGDHEFLLGSAANSTPFFSRRVLSAPSGKLRFQFGAQISFIIIGDGEYSYSLLLILRNETTGEVAKCRLAAGSLQNNMSPGTEGVIVVPFQTFDICDCPPARDLATSGDLIEIQLVPSVRADARKPGSSAFIGGPFFFDNFQFCNILCPIPFPDEPVELAQIDPVIEQNPLTDEDVAKLTGEKLRTRALDINGDGVVNNDDLTPIIDRTAPTPDVNRDGVITMDDAFLVLDVIDGHEHAHVNVDVNGDNEVNELDIKVIMEAGDLR
jgi:hypothetical protein